MNKIKWESERHMRKRKKNERVKKMKRENEKRDGEICRERR